jgi:hypothetical protein
MIVVDFTVPRYLKVAKKKALRCIHIQLCICRNTSLYMNTSICEIVYVSYHKYVPGLPLNLKIIGVLKENMEYIYICIFIYTYPFTHMYLYVCIYMRIHLNIILLRIRFAPNPEDNWGLKRKHGRCIHMYIYIYISIYTYISICIYV